MNYPQPNKLSEVVAQRQHGASFSYIPENKGMEIEPKFISFTHEEVSKIIAVGAGLIIGAIAAAMLASKFKTKKKRK